MFSIHIFKQNVTFLNWRFLKCLYDLYLCICIHSHINHNFFCSLNLQVLLFLYQILKCPVLGHLIEDYPKTRRKFHGHPELLPQALEGKAMVLLPSKHGMVSSDDSNRLWLEGCHVIVFDSNSLWLKGWVPIYPVPIPRSRTVVALLSTTPSNFERQGYVIDSFAPGFMDKVADCRTAFVHSKVLTPA